MPQLGFVDLKAAPAQTLQTFPGLGPAFTSGITAQIGDVNRFKRKPLAKFAGLTWGFPIHGFSGLMDLDSALSIVVFVS